MFENIWKNIINFKLVLSIFVDLIFVYIYIIYVLVIYIFRVGCS